MMNKDARLVKSASHDWVGQGIIYERHNMRSVMWLVMRSVFESVMRSVMELVMGSVSTCHEVSIIAQSKF